MTANDKSILDDPRIGRLLFKMSLPIFFSTFVTMMYNVVSAIFVGNYVGGLGIGGIAVVLPIQNLSMGISMFFGIGGASVISRSIGAGNRDLAERTLGNAILCAVVISLLLAAFGLLDIDFWLKLIGASSDILPYARDYMRIILYGIVFQTLSLSLSTMITAEGNARVSMTGMMLGAISNIIFDAAFVVLLGWGVKGAAFGNILAQMLSTAFLFSHYFRGKSYLKLHWWNLVLRAEILKSIAVIGISSLFMNLSWTAAAIILNTQLMTYGGGMAVSAYGIISRLNSITTLPGMAVGQGMQPILGYNFGKHDYEKALKVIKMTIGIATFFSFLIFILFQAFPSAIVRIFSSDPELAALSSHALRVVFSTNFVTGLIISGICTFQSLGKGRQSFLISLRTVVFLLPFSIIFPHFFGLEGVFFTYPMTELCGFLLAVSLLIPQISELRRLKAESALSAESVESMSSRV